MLQACALADTSSDKHFLAKLQEVAPPVIRQCIIERAKLLPAGEIADKAAHYRDATNSDEVTQAQFAVRYLSESCFSNLDIDPPPENGNPWRSPQAFIVALQNHVLLESYDLGRLQEVVDAYNLHQDCLFGLLQPCVSMDNRGQLLPTRKMLGKTEQTEFNFPDVGVSPRGHTQIRLIATEGLFILAITLTERSHTPAVDDGANHFKTVLFRQADMSVVSQYDALYLDLPERVLSVLSEGAQTDCMGTRYGEYLIIVDGATSGEVGRIRLPDGVQRIEPQGPSRKGRLQLRVHGQKIVDDPREERCEFPSWAKHYDFRYTLHCDAPRKKCHVEKRLIHTYQGCASIGGCD